jgi:chromosome segregation ATPase
MNRIKLAFKVLLGKENNNFPREKENYESTETNQSSEFHKLKNEIVKLEANLTSLELTKGTYEGTITRLDQANQALQSTLDQKDNIIRSREETINELNRSIDTLRREVHKDQQISVRITDPLINSTQRMVLDLFNKERKLLNARVVQQELNLSRSQSHVVLNDLVDKRKLLVNGTERKKYYVLSPELINNDTE